MTRKSNERIFESRLAGAVVVTIGLSMVVAGAFGRSADATQVSPEHKITLCHATDSYSNPYVAVDVDVASVQFQGHDGHNGPIFFPDIPKHEQWGDIIPPFDYGDGNTYGGKNWPEGQAILDAGCAIPTATTTTTTTETGTSTTTEPTTTTTIETEGSTTIAPTTTNTIVTQGSTITTPKSTTVTSTVKPEGESSTKPSSTIAPNAITGLPKTGSPGLPLTVLGVALIGAGTGLILARRRQLG